MIWGCILPSNIIIVLVLYYLTCKCNILEDEMVEIEEMLQNFFVQVSVAPLLDFSLQK
jgi:hypothetical protein